MPTCVMSGEVRNAVQHTTQLWGRRWRVRGKSAPATNGHGPSVTPDTVRRWRVVKTQGGSGGLCCGTERLLCPACHNAELPLSTADVTGNTEMHAQVSWSSRRPPMEARTREAVTGAINGVSKAGHRARMPAAQAPRNGFLIERQGSGGKIAGPVLNGWHPHAGCNGDDASDSSAWPCGSDGGSSEAGTDEPSSINTVDLSSPPSASSFKQRSTAPEADGHCSVSSSPGVGKAISAALFPLEAVSAAGADAHAPKGAASLAHVGARQRGLQANSPAEVRLRGGDTAQGGSGTGSGQSPAPQPRPMLSPSLTGPGEALLPLEVPVEARQQAAATAHARGSVAEPSSARSQAREARPAQGGEGKTWPAQRGAAVLSRQGSGASSLARFESGQESDSSSRMDAQQARGGKDAGGRRQRCGPEAQALWGRRSPESQWRGPQPGHGDPPPPDCADDQVAEAAARRGAGRELAAAAAVGACAARPRAAAAASAAAAAAATVAGQQQRSAPAHAEPAQAAARSGSPAAAACTAAGAAAQPEDAWVCPGPVAGAAGGATTAQACPERAAAAATAAVERQASGGAAP